MPPWIAAGALAAAVAGLAAVNAARMDPGPAFLASSHAADILDSLPFEAQLIAEGDYATHTLLYAQIVEQRRTDVAVFAGDPTIFQGYGRRSLGSGRLFFTSADVVVAAGGRRAREHGILFVSSASDEAPGPDPGEVYRPLPDDDELRRQGRRDAMAQTVLVDRLNRRWDQARAAGNRREAERLAGQIVAESEAYLRMIVPREDQFRSMVKMATRLERWDLLVYWTERLAGVSTLDPRFANNLAWAYLETRGDLARAEDLARSAVASQPDNAQFLDTLAAVLEAAGKRDEAGRVLRRAREAEGGSGGPAAPGGGVKHPGGPHG